MSNPKIETYRGRVPLCRNCQRPVRPNYETVRENVTDGDTPSGTRRHYLGGDERRCGYSLRDSFPDITAEEEAEAARTHKPIETGDGPWIWLWDARKKDWYRIEKVYSLKSRKFLGTFGPRGDGLFCCTECGYRWAVKHLSRNARQG